MVPACRLRDHGCYGLMVSLTSRLTGIAGPIEVRENDGHVAVYVPNAGFDGFGVVWGATILKAIATYEARMDDARVFATGAIEQAWSRLRVEIDELDQVVRDVSALRESLRDTRKKVATAFESVEDRARSAELRLEHALQRITKRLEDELFALPATGTPVLTPAASAPDEVLAAIEALRQAKDKRLPAFEGLYEIAKDAGVGIALGEDGTWLLVRDGDEIARTSGTKTRLDLEVRLDPEKEATLLPSVETVKGDGVVIGGRDVGRFLERAERWLVGE